MPDQKPTAVTAPPAAAGVDAEPATGTDQVELTGRPVSEPGLAGTNSIAGRFVAEHFVKPVRTYVPQPGWRRLVWQLSRGRVRPAPGAQERRRLDQLGRIRTRVDGGCRKVAFASAKGGVGKTTGTTLCGMALAMHRADRVVAVDANPDAGSLGWRVRQETRATLTDLLREASRIERYSDIRAFTSQTSSRLEVLASENDPAVDTALGDADYLRAIELLERHYNVILCDLGTGLLDSATQGVFRAADQLVVVTAPSLDAGRVAGYTLDFIERRFPEKVRDAVVVINSVYKESLVDVELLDRHFCQRVRSVIRIPFDRHLATGGEPEWDHLRPATRAAYMRLAAAVGEGFGSGGAAPSRESAIGEATTF